MLSRVSIRPSLRAVLQSKGHPGRRRLCGTVHHQRRCQTTVSSKAAALIGQPTHETRPHLLKEGEVTIGIQRQEFRDRRRRLVEALPADSMGIIPGFGLRYMSSNIFYPFHQNPNFLYLTGLHEPDAALVIDKDENSKTKFILFVKPSSQSSVMWDGHKTGLDEAIQYFEADESRPIQELPSYLESLTETSKQIFTDLNLGLTKSAAKPLDDWPVQTNSGHATDNTSSKWSLPNEIRSNYQTYLSGFFSKESFKPIRRISPLVQSLRVQKSAAELRVMREAGRISGRAFAKTMSQTKPGLTEHQISALLNYEVSRRGANSLAYVPVVAGGANALTLHYVRNDDILKDGDLLLVDAGGLYGHYCSDITRVWPVNGKFTEPQKMVYQAVLRVQKVIIKKCTEESDVSLNMLQDETFDLLREECSKLFKRSVSTQEMERLYPHHVGHWIGLDLHDTETVSRNTKLRPGMTLTVEPGLYIPNEPQYPEDFRGIGIRIEDDVAVGKTIAEGPLVLTAEAPKEVEDIEAVMSGSIVYLK